MILQVNGNLKITCVSVNCELLIKCLTHHIWFEARERHSVVREKRKPVFIDNLWIQSRDITQVQPPPDFVSRISKKKLWFWSFSCFNLNSTASLSF